jgi:hypothetical protein
MFSRTLGSAIMGLGLMLLMAITAAAAYGGAGIRPGNLDSPNILLCCANNSNGVYTGCVAEPANTPTFNSCPGSVVKCSQFTCSGPSKTTPPNVKVPRSTIPQDCTCLPNN